MPKYHTLIHKLFLINKLIKHRDVASVLKRNLIRFRFHKILSIDPEVIGHVFKYINGATRFHHIEFNGLPYYETNNLWATCNIEKRPSYDVDVPCGSYRGCGCSRAPTIFPNDNDKIKYILEYNEIDVLSWFDNPKYENFVSHISQFAFQNVLLIGFDNLTIINNHGRNDDHRGSDHCNVYLPMHDKVSMKKYATLYDLAITYYKLKSHKWDDNYEMFCHAETRMQTKSGNAEVFLTFDHGS